MKLRKKAILGVSIISMLGILLFMNKNDILYSKIEENSIENEIESGIAVYVANDIDYERVDAIPESGYALNEELSYCNESEVKNDNIKISYDMDTKMISITPVANEKTKCYLYFDVKVSVSDTILTHASFGSGTPNFSNTSCTTGCMESTVGLYTAEDDDGISYYFRGDVTDNYFKFAGFYWRIVRINGDGSIRLIYQGLTADATGENAQIGTSSFNPGGNNNMYVGFMYSSGQVHGLTEKSVMLATLETWYENNLINYTKYIDSDAGFCNDRYPSTSYTTSNGNGGIGSTVTYYASYIRLEETKKPTLKCQDANDLFTLSSSSKGNKTLSYAIGLITADEANFAGSISNYSDDNKIEAKHYLNTGEYYYTLSPGEVFPSSLTTMYIMQSDGGVFYYNGGTDMEFGVRPVINLRSDIKLSGTGTQTDPYMIQTT